MDLIKKIKINLLALNIALGPILWFVESSLNSIKIALFLILIIAHYNVFFKYKNYRYLVPFLTVLLLMGISLASNNNFNEEALYLIFTVIQNYCFLILGINFSPGKSDLMKLIFKVVSIICVFCALTLTNFLLGLPDWIQPFQLERYDDLTRKGYRVELNNLYTTGFGLARTGWSTTLTQYIPLAFYLLMNMKRQLIAILLIVLLFSSILVSGSRGGVLILLLMISLYIQKYLGTRILFMYMLMSVSMIFLIFKNSNSTINEYYRLDEDDLSTGRAAMYAFVPQLIEKAGLFGSGLGSSRQFLGRHLDEEHEFHNVYLKIFIDHGVVLGLLNLFIVLYLLQIAYLTYKFRNEENIATISLVIVAGIVSGLLEPSAMFLARFWWLPFWFFVGVLVTRCNDIKQFNFKLTR